MTSTGRLRSSFVSALPPGPSTLNEKFAWVKQDLHILKEASHLGTYGLGHLWGNLQRRWRQGIDTRSKYSGMNTWETGMDFIQQDNAPLYDYYTLFNSWRRGGGAPLAHKCPCTSDFLLFDLRAGADVLPR
eukprot:7222422-Karenia_brevis.AAC.1